MRSKILTSRFRERVIVNTKQGGAFAGVLYSCDKQALVLREAEAVGEGENRTNLALDGEVILLFADVEFIQRPG